MKMLTDDDDKEGEDEVVPRNLMSRDASLAGQQEGPSVTDIDGDAMVSVQCSQITSQGSVAATTTFSPWPGLLTSTLIATNDDNNDDDDDISSSPQIIQSFEEASPPRRLPPPPTPSRVSEEGTAPPMQDSSQTIIQPPPPAPLTALPPPPPRTTSQRAPSIQNEVVDTTDAKQKSWTKKLGL